MDAVAYNNKTFDHSEKLRSVVASLGDSLKHTIIVNRFNIKTDIQALGWSEFIDMGRGKSVEFKQLPFSHPVYILYSSGTTGPPKCIVHNAGVL